MPTFDGITLFMHLIKTGGSTICNHMITHCPENTHDQDAPHTGGGRITFYAGHNVRYGIHRHLARECRYMTIVRDPADWYVSVYNHQMARDGVANPPPFEEWLDFNGTNSVNTLTFGRNAMFRWFVKSFAESETMDAAKNLLNICFFVGITDKLDMDLPGLFEGLGAPSTYENKRVAGEYDEIDRVYIKKVYELTNDMREKIYRENPLDMELYQEGLKIWELNHGGR